MQRVFRSEHALALYENTRRFLVQGETPWIAIETFRTLMGVHDKPYYDEYKYLNARLIKPAMQQVNESSDIQLGLKTRRKSRVVAELKFLVSANPQMSLFTESLVQKPTIVAHESKRRVLVRLFSYRITGKRAEQILDHHSEDDIIAALDAADAWMDAKEANREPINNPAGVAYKAVTEGWRLPETKAPATIDGKHPANPDKIDKDTEVRDARRRDTLRAEFRRRWYADYIKAASEQSLEELKTAFEDSLVKSGTDKMVLDKLRKHGLNGIVLGVFQHFLASQGIEPDNASFEAYVREKSKAPTKP
jgi:hypothetical protein